MIKLKPLLFENRILIPRRNPEEREKTHIAEYQRIIQKYIKDGCRGNLNLARSPIKILPDNLTRVVGDLNLGHAKIEDLNNLETVYGTLYLNDTPNLKSIGKLKYISGDLELKASNLSNIMSEEAIRRKVRIEGGVYFH